MMLNKSFTYILPMLSTEIDIVKDGLVNTFIGDEEYPQYDNHIFLLYKFSGSKEFLQYEDFIKNTHLFVHSYDPDDHHVMYVLDVPSFYQTDYNLFAKGKYSEMNRDYKIIIFAFHNIVDYEHRVAKVLFKHPDLREEWEERTGATIPDGAEVSSVPDLKKEVYNETLKVINPVKPEKEPFD
jgi:hypothetical protein|tara:strand:- start:44 stop:589 length:546 start_codon:yes stop_codon:yes gene_type:complete